MVTYDPAFLLRSQDNKAAAWADLCRALAIVRAAAPFGPFSKAMRQQADQIWVVSRFRFTRDETLETTITAQP